MYASTGRVAIVSEIRETAEKTALTCRAVLESTNVPDIDEVSRKSPEPQIL
jgi:hypothetical protein